MAGELQQSDLHMEASSSVVEMVSLVLFSSFILIIFLLAIEWNLTISP